MQIDVGVGPLAGQTTGTLAEHDVLEHVWGWSQFGGALGRHLQPLKPFAVSSRSVT